MDLFGFSTWPRPGWETLERLRRDVDELFQGRGALGLGGQPYPAVNLYETENGYVLTAELPGLLREDLGVSIEANRVTLRGEREITYPRDERSSLHRRERQAGSFRRTVDLPIPVDSDKAEAIYRHGVLMLRLPKAAEHRPRQIAVQGS